MTQDDAANHPRVVIWTGGMIWLPLGALAYAAAGWWLVLAAWLYVMIVAGVRLIRLMEA